MVEIKKEPQPQAGTATVKSLESLRSRIDALDEELLALIERRLALSASAATVKEKDATAPLRLRPRREAEILDRLVDHASAAPETLVRRVWRELMAFGLHAQGPIELLIHAPGRNTTVTEHTRARFGSAAAITQVPDVEQCLHAARTREAVAIVELHPLSNWWVELGSEAALRIFDTIGDETGDILALAIGRVSEQDVPPSPLYPIIGMGSLELRRGKGENIRALAAAGHLRLCLSQGTAR
ncbi:chorismate mutase [Sphingosinicella rhizophila]|uniref:chorismate mutase n=1 Tax=Sphingosinicella rhizophila TaxID=3050082 RepID=A0ABU3Q9H2_9SPHN|nr:chorismate mutase [Sphingosinicella sp. GR2756]MDT9599942.1 chorismate mutase [Sphingosinicella sp. GR2756]